MISCKFKTLKLRMKDEIQRFQTFIHHPEEFDQNYMQLIDKIMRIRQVEKHPERTLVTMEVTLVWFSAFVRDITDRGRAERRLASQYAVTRVLGDAATLEEAAPKIIQAVGESLEWELGVYWKLDKPSGLLRCLDQWKAAELHADQFVMATWEQSFQPGEGLAGRIWASGQPVWITDVAADFNLPRSEEAAKEGLHGTFGFPIRVGGEIEGVIEFFSRQVREPDDELLNMMADVGLKLGQFGERTRVQEAAGD